ncbi:MULTISPECIES: retropepsin-like aspartic protease [unclassified Microcoleus]|uniref:retropepsin-like aspartic protease family protein n=1 Tax=unclassified Microcoleus TaxID=2642155 RepID=UPI0025F0DD3A|nr:MULTISPECIES: retropepsin-like aspartic protease [unclassified Microcoleus]
MPKGSCRCYDRPKLFHQITIGQSPLPLSSNSMKSLPNPQNLRKPLLAFTAVISLSSSILLDTAVYSSRATAQESEGCFMRNSSGQTVSLSRSVCGFAPQESTPPTAPASPASPAAPASPASPASPDTKSGVFLVKIKRREANIPVIEVTFNGKQKFEMMVDSGASRTVITPAMATALGIVPKGTVQAKTPNGEATFSLGSLTSIEAGGLAINNIVVPISPALEIGLLGHDFFGNKDVTIKQDVIEFRTRV